MMPRVSGLVSFAFLLGALPARADTPGNEGSPPVLTVPDGDWPSKPASASPPSASVEADALVVVRLEVNNPGAVLERRPPSLDRRSGLASSQGFVPVCIAPCGVSVPRTGHFRVGGTDIAPTWELKLPDGPGPVIVRAEVISASRSFAGFLVSTTGAGTVLLGAAVLGIWGQGRGGFSNDAGKAVLASSVTGMSLGAVMAIVGVSLLLTGGKSKLEIAPNVNKKTGGLRWVPGGLAF